jgi:hypothetical protein
MAVYALLAIAFGGSHYAPQVGEAVLGGAVRVAVSTLVWPPNPVRTLRREYRELRRRFRDDLRRTLDGLGAEARADNCSRVRANSEFADEVVASIGQSVDALRWNPWHLGRRHELTRLEDRLRMLSYLYRTLRTLAWHVAEADRVRSPESRAAGDGGQHVRALDDATVEAVERRLQAQDAATPVARARDALGDLRDRLPPDDRMAAPVAVLDDLVADIERWRTPTSLYTPPESALRLALTTLLRAPRS